MRKYFVSAWIASVVLLASLGILAAQGMKFYHFPFIGRWNPSEDALLIDDYGFQDIQNLRKDGKHLKGVYGHSPINTTYVSGVSNTYSYIVNGFHFFKDQPSKSYIITYAGNATSPTAGALYYNTTAIPGAGNFNSTALHTPSAYNNPWRFSMAPDGNMVAANGDETLIWGGDEIEATAFVTSSTAVTYQPTNSNDYTNVVNNTRQTASETVILSATSLASSSLLHFDGADGGTTFTDEKGLTWTAAGNAQTDTAQFKFGTASGLFDGTGDYVSSSANAAYRFAGDFTVDFWVRFNSNSSTQHFIDFRTADSSATGFVIYYAGAVIVYSDSNPKITGGSLSNGQWYHIAVTRSGSSFKLFIDGTQSGSTWTTSANFSDGTPVVGGPNTPGGTFNGWIDELNINNTTALWTSNFTVPTQSYGGSSGVWLIGVKRPVQGFKYYISSGNTSTSSMTVKEWTGASWSSLSITDGTASGGKTLAQTGSVTFSSTVNTSKVRYISGLSLYWYQFSFDVGQASIYYVTADAPIQTIKNIWDGLEQKPVKFLKWDGSTYVDYTADIEDDSLITYADLSSLTTSHYVLLGFIDPQQAFNLSMVAGQGNSNASVMTAYYWDGSDWTALSAFNDASVESGKSLSKSGIVSFQGQDKGTEFPRAIGDEYPLYYYKLLWSANLDASVQVGEVAGVPYPATVSPFLFSEQFQNRLFLFNEKAGVRNKAVYSVSNAPDLWNGSDYGELYFGDKTDLTGAVVVYNVFSVLVVEQMIVTKRNETWRVSGNSPSDWVVMRMSGNIGNVAPLSMAACDITDVSTNQDMKRSVAIWVSDRGPVMSDGANIYPIYDDIKCYWDPSDSRFIPLTMQSKSMGWYDPVNRSYKLLVASGSGATYLNTELEYSLKYREWTKIYRENGAGANPLQSGWQVRDTNGLGYSYGGGKDGYVYRLENGTSWNGIPINQYVQTKDMLFDSENPLLKHTTVNYLRVLFKDKSSSASENITFSHYGDRVLTVSGTSNQYVPPAVLMSAGPVYTWSSSLGPNLMHSFKFTTSAASTVYGGQELIGFGVYYTPHSTIFSNELQ